MTASPGTSRQRLRPSLIAVAAAVAAFFALSLAARAHADGETTKAFHPVGTTGRALIFRPRNVDGRSVVRASVTYRVDLRRKTEQRTRRIPVRRIRHALEHGKRLKVAKPRQAEGGRLLVRARKPGGPQGSSCEFGAFSASAVPGACWRPYSDYSPFNRGVGTAPRALANSSAVVSRLTGFGPPQSIVGGSADTRDDWDHPLYFSQPSDPVYTIHCVEDWGTCEIEGMQVRIPDVARPAGGEDGSMGVIDQAGNWEYDFWQVRSKPSGGGTITVSWGGRTEIGTPTADGLGSNATAAHFGTAAGVIRPEELKAGLIDHALFLVVKCTNGTYVWPAHGPGAGRSCSSIGLSNANAPALGQHFYLDMTDAQIAALQVPQWKRTILTAMAHYGMFVGDTGGDSWRLKVQSGTSHTSFGFGDPWVRLGRALGADPYQGDYVFALEGGVDWSRLAVADPCVSKGSC